MAKKIKTKKKNIVLYILTTLFLVALVVGIVFACTSLLRMQKDYILFIVADKENNNVVKSSNDNVLNFGKTYTFNVKYVFAEEENNKKNYDFEVNITGCQNLDLFKGEYSVQLNKLDLSNSFKIEKKNNQFTLTIPPAEEFFEIIFAEYLDQYRNKVYIHDLCEKDYFSLNIVTYNRKDIINYKFRVGNNAGEICAVEEISTNYDEIDFTEDLLIYPVEEIELSEDFIIFREID